MVGSPSYWLWHYCWQLGGLFTVASAAGQHRTDMDAAAQPPTRRAGVARHHNPPAAYSPRPILMTTWSPMAASRRAYPTRTGTRHPQTSARRCATLQSVARERAPVRDLATSGPGSAASTHTRKVPFSQSMTIPSGTATLTFWLEIPVCDSTTDYLEVKLDSTQVYLVSGNSPLCGSIGYVQQTVNVNAWANGGNHTLTFHSETFSNNGGISNFFVDDVRLDATAGGPTNTPTPTATPTPTRTPTRTPTPTATATGGPPAQTGPGVRLSEVMHYPLASGPEWVELRNYAASPVSLRGHSLRDEDGNVYHIPAPLPSVPAGADRQWFSSTGRAAARMI